MKNTVEAVLFGLFGLWIILIPVIMIAKIKYFKTLRQKEFNGTSELFSFLSSEWWIAGLTWGIPIIGRDRSPEVNQIRGKANLRLYILYFIILTQLVLAGLLKRFA